MADDKIPDALANVAAATHYAWSGYAPSDAAMEFKRRRREGHPRRPPTGTLDRRVAGPRRGLRATRAGRGRNYKVAPRQSYELLSRGLR